MYTAVCGSYVRSVDLLTRDGQIIIGCGKVLHGTSRQTGPTGVGVGETLPGWTKRSHVASMVHGTKSDTFSITNHASHNIVAEPVVPQPSSPAARPL